MREMTVAVRYNQNWKFPWNNTIQLIRDEMIWDKDEGFTMSGIWQGRLPENGLYKFEPVSKVKFTTTKENVLKDRSILMYVTFNTDFTWQANDFWYNMEVGGQVTSNPTTKTADIASFANYAFAGYESWLGSGYDLSDNHASNQVPYDFKDWNPATTTLDICNNDYYGYGAFYGGLLFIGRSINYRYKPKYKLYKLNGLALGGSNIIHDEIKNRKAIAFTLNDNQTVSYRTTYLNATAGNAYQSSQSGGTATNPIGNRGAFVDLYRISGSERKDYVPNLEGSRAEYQDGYDRTKPIVDSITLNGVYEPYCGFPTTTTTSGFNVGIMLHPKRIDFYNRTTELFTVDYKASKDN